MARPPLLLLILGLGVAVGSVVDLEKRIIGGKTCEKKDRLYHVQLIGDGNPLCGGSLITRQWILTAAHCWEPGLSLSVVIGLHPGTERKVIKITEDPKKFVDSAGRTHDIMLVKLPNPDDVPASIPTISLPNCKHRLKPGKVVQVAGDGDTKAGPNNVRLQPPGISADLQCAKIKLVDCQRLREIAPHRLYQHWFCGQTKNVDTCPGDSGGGVVFNKMIYGVHSFTGDHVNACAEAAGFMDVCEYMDWIVGEIRPPNQRAKKLQCLNCG